MDGLIVQTQSFNVARPTVSSHSDLMSNIQNLDVQTKCRNNENGLVEQGIAVVTFMDASSILLNLR